MGYYIYKKMRLNEMHSNLQIEKKIGPILPKKLTKNHFVQTSMAYISLNIKRDRKSDSFGISIKL